MLKHRRDCYGDNSNSSSDNSVTARRSDNNHTIFSNRVRTIKAKSELPDTRIGGEGLLLKNAPDVPSPA